MTADQIAAIEPGTPVYRVVMSFGTYRLQEGQVILLPRSNRKAILAHLDGFWQANEDLPTWELTPEVAVRPLIEKKTAEHQNLVQKLNNLIPTVTP